MRAIESRGQLIFVSIAAYRDPQLVPTVEDCIRKAVNPERLRFGICWQRGEDEEQLSYQLDDSRFRVLDVPWQESSGACWARAQIMQLWQGEDWFLQVDSHCRFARGWDAMLLRAVKETGSDKPILSTYATPFTPGGNEVLRGGPLQVAFQAFTPEGIPQLKPVELQKSANSSRPFRARFLAAGFLFTCGRFVEEVPYDPDLYFMGEEAAMTVRAFTHGYDLFHPTETVLWHDYLRTDARKHWGDHTETNGAVRPWSELDERSRRKTQCLLGGESVESFGLGQERTLAQYEAYAGLSFRHQKAQLYTVRAQEPPNPDVPDNWTDSVFPWIVRVNIQRSELPAGSLDSPALWCLGIQDEQGYEVCRIDITPDKLAPFYGDERTLSLICEFSSEAVPAAWTIWPVSRSQGWLHKIDGRFEASDFAILREDSEANSG